MKRSESIIICIKIEGKIVGFIAGKAVNQFWNSVDKTALELAFFIEEQQINIHSIKLLYGAFKHWAKLVGCKTIMMGRIRSPGKQEEYYMKRLK